MITSAAPSTSNYARDTILGVPEPVSDSRCSRVGGLIAFAKSPYHPLAFEAVLSANALIASTIASAPNLVA